MVNLIFVSMNNILSIITMQNLPICDPPYFTWLYFETNTLISIRFLNWAWITLEVTCENDYLLASLKKIHLKTNKNISFTN